MADGSNQRRKRGKRELTVFQALEGCRPAVGQSLLWSGVGSEDDETVWTSADFGWITGTGLVALRRLLSRLQVDGRRAVAGERKTQERGEGHGDCSVVSGPERAANPWWRLTIHYRTRYQLG
jgi:hypothetical protein